MEKIEQEIKERAREYITDVLGIQNNVQMERYSDWIAYMTTFAKAECVKQLRDALMTGSAVHDFITNRIIELEGENL